MSRLLCRCMSIIRGYSDVLPFQAIFRHNQLEVTCAMSGITLCMSIGYAGQSAFSLWLDGSLSLQVKEVIIPSRRTRIHPLCDWIGSHLCLFSRNAAFSYFFIGSDFRLISSETNVSTLLFDSDSCLISSKSFKQKTILFFFLLDSGLCLISAKGPAFQVELNTAQRRLSRNSNVNVRSDFMIRT